MRWPHQSWREMHQSWMLLIQCRYVDSHWSGTNCTRPRSPVRGVDDAVADRREAEVLDRAAGKERMRDRRGRLHRDEPLVGQHRLDDFVRAAAARHDHPVRLFADEQTLRREIGEHRLARRVAIEAAILLRRVVVDRRVEIEDRDRREAVALADLPVVEVVRRRDLHAAGAEGLVDVGVGDDGDRAAGERQRDLFSDQRRCSVRRRGSPRPRRRPASSPAGSWRR